MKACHKKVSSGWLLAVGYWKLEVGKFDYLISG